MASLSELYSISIILLPIFSSLFALILLVYDVKNASKKPLKIGHFLIAYFSAAFISWFTALIYFYFPVIYVYINWLSMLAVLTIQVFYYGFIFEVTKEKEVEKFPGYHFILPVILSFFLLVLSLMTPYQDQISIISSKGVYNGEPRLFYYLTYSKMMLRLLFSLVYTGLGFIRLINYRRFMRDYSSNEEKNSLKWIGILLLLSVLLLPVPLLEIFSVRDEIVVSPFSIIPVLLLFFQYIYICLHFLKRDHFIVDLTEVSNTSAIKSDYHKNTSYIFEGSPELLKKSILSRDLIDYYMKTEKPYLNPNYRITDMVEIFRVNRTYISSFINSEYGVNFSSFFNNYRMIEYTRLKVLPENSGLSKQTLIEAAGFNSLSSFKRIEKDLKSNTLLNNSIF